MPQENEKEVHKYRSIIATLVTLLMLALVAWFAWRVVHYMQLIQSGQISAAELQFQDQRSMASRIANAPIPDGQVRVSADGDPSIGDPNAPVQIVEFADFGCPYSRQSSFVIRSLAKKYDDRIYYTYRDFPITDLHPQAEVAAMAAECARDQNKFWQYHDKLYLNQDNLSEAQLLRFAAQINLNTETFERCLTSEKYKDEVRQDYKAGFEAGVRGTPTFFINGVRIPGSVPEDVFTALIERFLTQS